MEVTERDAGEALAGKTKEPANAVITKATEEQKILLKEYASIGEDLAKAIKYYKAKSVDDLTEKQADVILTKWGNKNNG